MNTRTGAAALLEFIADFSAWESSTNQAYLETARAMTQSAHVALGGMPGTRPLVVDPFAGGGSIPLEALRLGCETFATDLALLRPYEKEGLVRIEEDAITATPIGELFVRNLAQCFDRYWREKHEGDDRPRFSRTV